VRLQLKRGIAINGSRRIDRAHTALRYPDFEVFSVNFSYRHSEINAFNPITGKLRGTITISTKSSMCVASRPEMVPQHLCRQSKAPGGAIFAIISRSTRNGGDRDGSLADTS
jgi:hypothetical protein